jgi:polyisoprenyl-phosphate glycosyltransferase
VISIIIPAYNEEKNLPQIIDELITSETFHEEDDLEIIVVDDHSTDGSRELLKRMNQDDSRIGYIRLSKNSGSHTAIRAGLMKSRGDCAIVISADGQDNPQDLGKMIKKWREGFHIVWALRRARDESLIYKTFARIFYHILKSVSDSSLNKIDLSRADFYLLDNRVVRSINRLKERNTSLFGIISWIGYEQTAIEYSRRNRKNGNSKWNFRSRMRLAVDWIIAFSGVPLRLITYIGLTVSLAGFVYAVYIFFCSFSGVAVQGWTSLMLVTLMLSGIILLSLGIGGEYMWRVLEETRDRPAFFIEDES